MTQRQLHVGKKIIFSHSSSSRRPISLLYTELLRFPSSLDLEQLGNICFKQKVENSMISLVWHNTSNDGNQLRRKLIRNHNSMEMHLKFICLSPISSLM